MSEPIRTELAPKTEQRVLFHIPIGDTVEFAVAKFHPKDNVWRTATGDRFDIAVASAAQIIRRSGSVWKVHSQTANALP